MTNEKVKNTYSEVSSFLNILLEEDRNKIPKKLRDLIENEKSKEYTPTYSYDIPIENQNISDEAIAMIALLHLNYWCCDNNEKERLNTIFDDNENKYQKELSEKYNPDNLFKNKQPKVETVENSVAMIEYKESIFTKIKKWFKRTFQ